MPADPDLFLIADELRAIANLGLQYATNDYDRERYQRVLESSARLLAGLTGGDPVATLAEYRANASHISPHVGADAAVFRDGKLLLIQRTDNQLWAMPGGLVEVGETAAAAAERELREEADLQGHAVRLLGIWDYRRVGSRIAHHLFHVAFEVEAPGTTLAPGPEALDAAIFGPDILPSLSPGHDVMVPAILALKASSSFAWFDR
jgi:ADP-ribose pyrophosphatase YjhB (NUDIX family)